MSWFSKLFASDHSDKVSSKTDEATLSDAFCADLGVASPGVVTALECVEHLQEEKLLSTVDWADDAQFVFVNLSAFFQGENALPDDARDAVLRAGNLAGEKGRGHAALPTLCALDEALVGTGDRLLWVETGGDAYDIARVPDVVWAKWHDVKIGDVQILDVSLRNEYPRQRNLRTEPR